MRPRAVIAASLFVAFVAALTLASMPRSHERLHGVDSQHECAATLIASGNYHHAAPPPVLPARPVAPGVPAFTPQNSRPVFTAVPSSVLEHAPPAAI